MKANKAPEQFISKSALVAEIERLISNGQVKLQESQECSDYESNVAWSEYIATYRKVLSFINTLEVKEVDLEKEIKEVQREYKTIEEYEGYPATIYSNDIECIAKNFFKLGIKVAQKGE